MDVRKWLKSPPTVSSAKSDKTPMMLPLEETLDDNRSLSLLLVAPWSPTLGLAGPRAATERMLPAAGQVQPRLGQYSGHNCLLDQ